MSRPTALVGARLIDPDSGYDGPGCVIVQRGLIAGIVRQPGLDDLSDDIERIDCAGNALHPGLIDLRVKTGEPGAEPKETLKSAARAAAAGGVTTLVIQPDTDPAIDDPAMVGFVQRRARDIELVHVLVAGAATRGGRGEALAEIGLMQEAGAVYFTDADRPITDSKVFRRVLSYAKGFGALVAHRPTDAHLTRGTCATDGDFAARLGLPSAPAIAESIGLERDLLLAEAVGARLLVDQITTGDACDRLAAARARGVAVQASASINHLSFNELDVGDYRTFYRLDPPLRAEADRRALIDAVVSGAVEIVTSAHTPAPAEDKRLPFAEAAPGAVGLETLLAALLTLHHADGADLLTLLRAVTSAPARLLGLTTGRVAIGAPADLVVTDLGAPRRVDALQLISKSRNSPFDGRRLQGEVLLTLVDGRVVHRHAGSPGPARPC